VEETLVQPDSLLTPGVSALVLDPVENLKFDADLLANNREVRYSREARVHDIPRPVPWTSYDGGG
jgi:hypothetical protein